MNSFARAFALSLVLAASALSAGAGCSVRSDIDERPEVKPDAADASTTDLGQDVAPGDAGGTWQQCCVNGVLTSCFCPAGMACNYGMGGLDCVEPDGGVPIDTGKPDVATDAPDVSDLGAEAGVWEMCCTNGVATTCWCPAGWACNYAWTCDAGRPDVAVDVPDTATDADAGGTWETCCLGGRITTCFCPAGVACNYGMTLPMCEDSGGVDGGIDDARRDGALDASGG